MPTRLSVVASIAALTAIAFAIACTAAEPDSSGRVPPPAHGSTAIICHADEVGPRLLISGRVFDDRGRPAVGASVTVYNTDAAGLYNPQRSSTRSPRISGTVKCDEDGRFQVLTVRPSAYPNETLPRHVHFETMHPGFKARYTEILFEGDPLLTPEVIERTRRYEAANSNAATEFVAVRRIEGGLETVEHTIRLQPN